MTDTKNLPVKNVDGLKALFESMKGSIAAILPKHLTPERVWKMLLVAATKQPELYRCTGASLALAIMRSSELGLDCSGTMGQAWIVPYGAIATFIPGYRGMIELARRSGKITEIQVHNVYERDKFTVRYGTESCLIHEPYFGKEPRGELVCSYIIAGMKDGVKQIEIMTKKEIDGIKARSKAKDSGPWKTDYEEMARKTVCRRGMKYLPLSPEIEKAIIYDNEAIGLTGDDIMQVEGIPGKDRIKALKDTLKADMVEGEDVTDEDMPPDPEPEPPEEQPEGLTEKDGSSGPKKYQKPEKPEPDLDAKISEDQKVELQEIIHENGIGKAAVNLILESHGVKLISGLRVKDFVSVKQALREI